MPLYEPIETGVRLNALASDLLSIRWETNAISADFILPDDDEHVLRISFDGPCIVRLLDEMALSTEKDDTPDKGLVANNFAYRLEGARFACSQSETWREVSAPVGQSTTHYRFVTGWACMDVLSGAIPSFSIAAKCS